MALTHARVGMDVERQRTTRIILKPLFLGARRIAVDLVRLEVGQQ
jgi:hypothetical protein